MNVVYAGNAKIFKGVLLSLMSVVKHTNSKLNVYILTMDLSNMNPVYTPITQEHCEIFRDVIKEKNQDSEVTLLDVTQNYINTLDRNKNHNTMYTPYTIIRLY